MKTVRRIVTLLPSATEIVYALGLGDRIVGVTHECDFPPDAGTKIALTSSTIPAAGSAAEIDRHVRASVHAGSSLYALDAERLAELAPDLIVTQELCEVCAVSYERVARAAKRVRGDPRVVSLEPFSLADVFANIETIGMLAGVPDSARALVASLRERLAALERHIARLARSAPSVLVLEWTEPPMSGGHWTPGLVAVAGGRAMLGAPGANSTVLAWSAIAAADPDVVIVAPCGFACDAAVGAAAELARTEPSWRTLRAVREGRAFAMDGNAYVNRPGPRLIDTAEIFASIAFGEPYGAGRSDPRAFVPLPRGVV